MSLPGSVWLLASVLCWGFPSPHSTLSHAAVYYVTPHSPNPDCPSGEPCLTINEYAAGSHFDGDYNVQLFFLNGEHILTFQDLRISNNASLEMSASSSTDNVVFHMSNGTQVILQKIILVKFSKVKFFSQNDQLYENAIPACISATDISGLLLVTNVTVQSCQLSLQGVINAANITNLTAVTSSLQLISPAEHNNTYFVKNSRFYSSSFSLQIYFIPTETSSKFSFFAVESSSFYNSPLAVKLQNALVFEVTILNTTITGEKKFTGLNITTYNSVQLDAVIKNCSIVENYYGVSIEAFDKSQILLDIDQCFVANNSALHHTTDVGGIFVQHRDESVVITSITSSVLISNVNAQAGFSGSGLSRSQVTISNSTMQNKMYYSGQVMEMYGLSFHYSEGLNHACMLANLTNNQFEDIYYGLLVYGGNCTFEIYLSDSTFRRSPSSVLEAQGYSVGIEKGYNALVKISNCLFIDNKNQYAVIYTHFLPNLTMMITETVFERNMNGIQFVDAPQLDSVNAITIKDSKFESNYGVSIGKHEPQNCYITKKAYVALENVTFFNNTNLLPNTGIIQVDGSVSLNIKDSCIFEKNQGTSVWALATNVTLSGAVVFRDNRAYRGGALSLLYSMIRLRSVDHSNTSILFINNTASATGGGINIVSNSWQPSFQIDPLTGSSCFFEIEGVSESDLVNSVTKLNLIFIDNKASFGGIDAYGATPSSNCHPLTDSVVNASGIQHYIFKTSSSLSAISSDPKRVCLCDDQSKLMCANYSFIFYNTSHYPGEVFSLPLAVVGFGFGTVTGPVYAKLLPSGNNTTSALGNGQYVRQVTYNGCTPLEFTVTSLNHKETIVLITNNTEITSIYSAGIVSDLHTYNRNPNNAIPYNLITVPVYIEVTLLDCPPGFQLTGIGICDCSLKLRDIGIANCSIKDNKLYITRSGNQWIKPVYNPDGILYSKYCPFHYCKHEKLNLDISDPDKQCALGHTGILCGGCPSNLSLAIGSSRCINCSDNNHILLLIAFAAAGVLLVLFIKVLDMTVSSGTINGLVFYANIIWANQNILFPPHTQTSSLLQLLRIFIAWLNLDLGIETCFIQNLDGYWKTWLQFAFPSYIFLITGLIILIARHSVRATKILGNNSVSVLATLFLISYTKLLRIILIVLDFTVIEYPDGQKVVWSFDGNILYFGLKHSILFVVVAILVLFGLPYTVILLFARYLRKHSHRRFLRWISKLHPLFDSYLGPLRVKHHYWIGLGLLARLLIQLTSTITQSTMPSVTAAVIVIVVLVLFYPLPNVYKQWQLNILEFSFLFNLAAFSSLALFIEAHGGYKDPLACTSLGVAFLLFLTIIGYQVWRRLRCCKKERKTSYEDIDTVASTSSKDSIQTKSPVTHQTVIVPEFREALLEDVTQ